MRCSLQTTGYPYVAVLAFSGARTKLIAAVEGRQSASQLQTVLQQAVGAHEGQMAVEQADANERVCHYCTASALQRLAFRIDCPCLLDQCTSELSIDARVLSETNSDVCLSSLLSYQIFAFSEDLTYSAAWTNRLCGPLTKLGHSQKDSERVLLWTVSTKSAMANRSAARNRPYAPLQCAPLLCLPQSVV